MLQDRIKTLRDEAATILGGEELTQDSIQTANQKIAMAKSLVDTLQSQTELDNLTSAPKRPTLPMDAKSEGVVSEKETTVTDSSDLLAKSVTILRFGTTDGNDEVIQREVYGKSYNELNAELETDFRRYLVDGTSKSGKRQVWDYTTVKSMLERGNTIAEVKSTMVEAEDVLGGVAVPPERASQVLRRIAGLTAVRAGGATVVRTTGKSIDWLEITGADAKNRYPSALRGAWGNETKNRPDERNLTFGLKSVPAHIYTYRVPFSISLLEDAPDIVSWFIENVATTLSIDEDEAFLIGDGVKKPWGILPNGLNTRGLTNVNSGSATTLTMDGLKGLRRGIASQYRANGSASMVGTSATGGVVEKLKDGEDRYFFNGGIEVGEKLDHIKATWRENEALPEIAGGAIPLIYGNFSGYVIVERMGLSIQRYNDSYTGINLVDYQVRRRLGGDVIEPWKFAVQTISS